MSALTRIHSLNLGMARAYLVESQDGLLLVDAGSPRQEQRVLRLMHKLRRDDLRLIFITHAHLDHYGSAAALRRLTGAPIAIHRLDANAMRAGETPLGTVRGRGVIMQHLLNMFEPLLGLEPTPPTLILENEWNLAEFGFQATVIHTPGHTPGSCCLLIEGRYAFAGDLISTSGKPHAQRYYAHEWSQIPKSLARLQALAPEKTYPGHGRRPLKREELLALTAS
jgi:glyoxylase-like metal-dependent hydrolase (beta-lactamase superfamily II)